MTDIFLLKISQYNYIHYIGINTNKYYLSKNNISQCQIYKSVVNVNQNNY